MRHDPEPQAGVVVVGSLNHDLVFYMDRWPGVGETVTADETRFGTGGKGANQAAAAARMGSRTLFVGAIGDDAFGADAERDLSGFGVSLTLRKIAAGLAFIKAGRDGGNIIRIVQGANALLGVGAIVDNHLAIRSEKVVLLQNETALATAIAVALCAGTGGAVVVMDPVPAPGPMWPADVISHFDILTPNATEVGLITGVTPPNLTEGLRVAHVLAENDPAWVLT